MTNRLNVDVIRQFWKDRARTSSNRWTSAAMLDFEVELLKPLAATSKTVLDLGSGHGDLSRRLCPPGRRLLAVDWECGFASAFTEPHHHFETSLVTEFSSDGQFDLVLLFGVVTCLDKEQEVQTYGRIAAVLAGGGTAVVKNQCATADEFIVDTHSEALGTRYSGRYPSQDEQRERLEGVFSEVEAVEYPKRFNTWHNSRHVAFLCRRPL